VAYSPYLLSGLLRCGCCGARMVAQTTTRKKGGDIYRYGVYRCGFAKVVFQGYGARTAELTGEIERLGGQASHLVRFLATGGDSPAVRAELRTIETTLEGRRAEWATIEKASALPPRGSQPNWNGWTS